MSRFIFNKPSNFSIAVHNISEHTAPSPPKILAQRTSKMPMLISGLLLPYRTLNRLSLLWLLATLAKAL